jgi:proteasome lid subunit RPN8/RPN11
MIAMLTITKKDLQQIIDHCIKGLPNEACGMLAGRDGRVERSYCMSNARPGPAYYEMEAEEQFRVMKDIRESGLDLIGLFHSHPTGRAYPSSVDVAQAYWPGTELPNYPAAVYVIISLMDRAKPVARGYMIEEGTVNEVQLTILS